MRPFQGQLPGLGIPPNMMGTRASMISPYSILPEQDEKNR